MASDSMSSIAARLAEEGVSDNRKKSFGRAQLPRSQPSALRAGNGFAQLQAARGQIFVVQLVLAGKMLFRVFDKHCANTFTCGVVDPVRKVGMVLALKCSEALCTSLFVCLLALGVHTANGQNQTIGND